MHSIRKNLAILLLALVSLATGCAVFSWWSGTGPVAEALRNVTGGGERSSISADDVPACGPAWRVVESPNPSPEYSELHAAAAVSPDDVWAVGTRGNEEFARTLIARWDGARWSEVPSPSVTRYSNHLHAVSAVSGREAWAVGGAHTGSDFWQTLVLRWDGSEWRIVPSPNVTPITILNGVAALSERDVWAVGEYSEGRQGRGPRTLLMHWNGVEWSVVRSPEGGREGALNAVSASAPDDVWAVGSYTEGASGIPQPLVLHFDGSAWRAERLAGAGELWSVSAVSPSNVWAVGNGGPRTLTMRFDGSAWRAVVSPNPGDGANSLTGVVATGENDAWAVGAQNVRGSDRPLALHWDGAAWRPAPIPYVGTRLDTLTSVADVSPGDVWAVGSYIVDDVGTNLTLVQRYSDPCNGQ